MLTGSNKKKWKNVLSFFGIFKRWNLLLMNHSAHVLGTILVDRLNNVNFSMPDSNCFPLFILIV